MFKGLRACFACAVALAGCSEARDGASDVREEATGTEDPVPTELLAVLPKASDGRALLFSASFGDQRIEAVVDPTLDDAVTRWAQCLDIAVKCADADDAKASECIEALPRCATERGGRECCPGSCLGRFAAAVSSGQSVEHALERSLLSRDCVADLPAAPP